LQLIVQMCKLCTHIIIVQIMIDNAKLHSNTICKYEMDLKLYALTFEVGKCITTTFFINLLINLNILPKSFITKKFLYLNKRSSQRWWTMTIKYYHLKHYVFINYSFFLFFLKWSLSHNFFIPICQYELDHIMTFNVKCEMRSITYI
jgi:hypothetical protein